MGPQGLCSACGINQSPWLSAQNGALLSLNTQQMSQSDPPAQDISNAKCMLMRPGCCAGETNGPSLVGVTCPPRPACTSLLPPVQTCPACFSVLASSRLFRGGLGFSRVAWDGSSPWPAAESTRRRSSERRIHSAGPRGGRRGGGGSEQCAQSSCCA